MTVSTEDRITVLTEARTVVQKFEVDMSVEEGRADSAFERRHYESMQQAALAISARLQELIDKAKVPG